MAGKGIGLDACRRHVLSASHVSLVKPSPEAPFVPLDRSGIAVVAGADLLLLDEFSPESLATLVRMLSPQAEALPARSSIVLEASGRNPADLKLYAKTGVDLNMRFALS